METMTAIFSGSIHNGQRLLIDHHFEVILNIDTVTRKPDKAQVEIGKQIDVKYMASLRLASTYGRFGYQVYVTSDTHITVNDLRKMLPIENPTVAMRSQKGWEHIPLKLTA